MADLQESVAETLEMEKAKMFLNDMQQLQQQKQLMQQQQQQQQFNKLPVNEESLMLAPESFC